MSILYSKESLSMFSNDKQISCGYEHKSNTEQSHLKLHCIRNQIAKAKREKVTFDYQALLYSNFTYGYSHSFELGSILSHSLSLSSFYPSLSLSHTHTCMQRTNTHTHSLVCVTQGPQKWGVFIYTITYA